MTPKNFEEAMTRLEQIVEELEKGDLSLEESLKVFEEGMELSRFCSEKLKQAENKLNLLVKKGEGFQLELASL